MSGLLFGVGALAILAGAAMIGFGIPINEFSFGNTLIIAGSTVAVGGLIVVGLGMVVAQLQRVTEALATRSPIRPHRQLDIFEAAAASRNAQASNRVPFPPKPKLDAGNRESFAPEQGMSTPMSAEEVPAPYTAPSLQNPEESPVTVEDEVSLSPRHPVAVPAPATANFADSTRHSPSFNVGEPEVTDPRHQPTLDEGWRPGHPPAVPTPTRQPHTAFFDSMWPAETKSIKTPANADAKPYEPRFDMAPREDAAAPAKSPELEAPKPHPEIEPRAVAILKSGVVDGMGYTLYVDGSIEAELPQGTLRFASINDLRSHLEKNA